MSILMDDRLEAAIEDLNGAVEFCDRVAASSPEERITIGHDQRDWLLAASRKVFELSQRPSPEDANVGPAPEQAPDQAFLELKIDMNAFHSARRLVARAFAKLKNVKMAVVRSLVADVDPAIARCEFDCRRSECSNARWRACENRKRYAEAEIEQNRRLEHA